MWCDFKLQVTRRRACSSPTVAPTGCTRPYITLCPWLESRCSGISPTTSPVSRASVLPSCWTSIIWRPTSWRRRWTPSSTRRGEGDVTFWFRYRATLTRSSFSHDAQLQVQHAAAVVDPPRPASDAAGDRRLLGGVCDAPRWSETPAPGLTWPELVPVSQLRRHRRPAGDVGGLDCPLLDGRPLPAALLQGATTTEERLKGFSGT